MESNDYSQPGGGSDREVLLCSIRSSLLPLLSALLLSLLLACACAFSLAVTIEDLDLDLDKDDVEVRGIAKSCVKQATVFRESNESEPRPTPEQTLA